MTRFARLALAALAVLLAFGAASAYAYPDTPKGAQNDCGAGNDPLTGHYTAAVLEKALSTLPTDDKEYSTCVDALERAIRADERSMVHRHTSTTTTTSSRTTTTTTTHHSTGQSHRGHRPKPSRGSTGPISSRISAAETKGRQPQRVDGAVVTPGAVTTRGSSFLGSIPTPILAVLAALIAALGALGGLAARNIVRARRSR